MGDILDTTERAAIVGAIRELAKAQRRSAEAQERAAAAMERIETRLEQWEVEGQSGERRYKALGTYEHRKRPK